MKGNKVMIVGENSFTVRSRSSVISRRYRIRGKITAAASFKHKNGKEYEIFFVPNRYYIFRSLRKVSGPHSFSSYRNNPLKIVLRGTRIVNAATTDPVSGRMDFYSFGSHYWQYDPTTRRTIQKRWSIRGRAPKITAAYTTPGGKTMLISSKYFFLEDSASVFNFGKKYPVSHILRCREPRKRNLNIGDVIKSLLSRGI